MFWLRWLGMSLAVVAGGGCATLVRGTRQEVKVTTDPPNALVRLDGRQYTTPCTITLERRKTYDVTISHPAYQSVTFEMQAKWDGLILPALLLPLGSLLTASDTAMGADRAFSALTHIKLQPSLDPKALAERVYAHNDTLLSEKDYRAALQAERSRAMLSNE